MNKEFIPYEQALALKELGFNESCFTTFTDKGEIFDVFDVFDDILTEKIRDIEDCYQCNDELADGYITAPLYQQVFRWFREKYNLHHSILFNDVRKNYDLVYGERIADKLLGPVDTYEEAELECLKQLIEIVKK